MSPQMGAPICASTQLTPIARSSVLLPLMLEPVINRNEPGGPTHTSLPTALFGGSSGCARLVASTCGTEDVCPASNVGNAQAG